MARIIASVRGLSGTLGEKFALVTISASSDGPPWSDASCVSSLQKKNRPEVVDWAGKSPVRESTSGDRFGESQAEHAISSGIEKCCFDVLSVRGQQQIRW